MKLLMRFYDVNGGLMKIDGNVDIRTMSRHGLRNNIAMVLRHMAVPILLWRISDMGIRMRAMKRL